ncbi:hypothetical protein [Candidatus Poriferisocius sp.]|uniref:hypothetical protein n=1 Tax=Candidatus Poriferisocius sp. TaxID=3101276 RepID=UPI003B02799E
MQNRQECDHRVAESSHRKPVATSLVTLLAAAAVLSAMGACGGDQPDLAAFCQKLGAASGPEGALASLAPNDPNAAEVAAKELEDLRRIAPLEIRPSLTTINATMGLVLAAFEDPDGNSRQSLQRMENEMAAYTEAASKLDGFAADHCGLELNPAIPAPTINPDRITEEVELNVKG